jgi:hypothetical protein
MCKIYIVCLNYFENETKQCKCEMCDTIPVQNYMFIQDIKHE